MTDPPARAETTETGERITPEPGEAARLPLWMYVVVGLFALGVAAALLGVRTCL